MAFFHSVLEILRRDVVSVLKGVYGIVREVKHAIEILQESLAMFDRSSTRDSKRLMVENVRSSVVLE